MAFQKTRTARFSDKELERIQIFLDQNPFLDFSTLVRLAVSNFIENPSLIIKPLITVNNILPNERGEKINGAL